MNLSRIESIVEDCFKRSTVKLGFLLDSNDNQIMLKNYARYKGAVEETDIISYYTSLELTDFTGTDLAAIPNIDNAKACMLTPSKVYEFLDAVGVERVLQNVRKRTIEEYVEKNSYVRILAGLPSLNDTELVYIPEAYKDLVSDHTKPIHLMSDEDLEKLYSRGVLTELADKFPNKVYINYLHRRSTIISIRDAADFELIHAGVIPGEELLSSTFKERWRLNREYFMNSHHNVFYQRTTDYYEALISMIIAWSVRVDMVRDSGFDIENDYYDDYELAAILQDFSLSLDGLPADIKRKVAANMSILVRNRGTVKVLENLCDIFDMKNVYNYVIQKIYVNGKAEIRCHAVPVKDMKNMRKYLTREYGYITYDKLISGDQTFSDKGMSARTTRTIEKKGTTDGYINTYHALLDKDFSYIHSKYVAVDNFIDMSQTSLDFALFYNYLLQADPLISGLQVTHKLGNFKLSLMQLYAYLCTLLSWKYHFTDNIIGSMEDMNYVIGLNHKLNLRKVPMNAQMIYVYDVLDSDIGIMKCIEYLDNSKTYSIDCIPEGSSKTRKIALANVDPVEVSIEVVEEVNIYDNRPIEVYFSGSSEGTTTQSNTPTIIYTFTNDVGVIDNTSIFFSGTLEPEVSTMDLVHIFECHFSGTEYMNILTDWINYNPGGTLDEFMNVYASDRKLINTLRNIMDETYDNDQYQICKLIIEKCTTLNAKNNTFGTFTKYSDYLAAVNPQAYTFLKNLKIHTLPGVWDEKFSNEITYILKVMKDFVSTLNSGEYDEAMSFLDDMRDTQLNEVKNVLSYLVSYFLSMSTTIRDPEFTFEIGDETDAFKIRESISKRFSDKKLNNFSPCHEDLSIARTRELEPDNYYIKDALYISHGINSKRYTKIGGDYEH